MPWAFRGKKERKIKFIKLYAEITGKTIEDVKKLNKTNLQINDGIADKMMEVI